MGLAGHKIVGIIQCRTGSTRLPNKALLTLKDKPMIQNYIQRVKRSFVLNEIVLATTTLPEDDILCFIAEQEGISIFRGSENNVFDRIFKAAILHNATIIVRLCADNPMIEPAEIDRLVSYYTNLSYIPHPTLYSNAQDLVGSQYPDGIGAELYDMESYNFGYYGNKEHPHQYFYDHEFYDSPQCPDEFAYPHIKLDVNTQKEYEYVKGIYDKFVDNTFHVTDYIGELV